MMELAAFEQQQASQIYWLQLHRFRYPPQLPGIFSTHSASPVGGGVDFEAWWVKPVACPPFLPTGESSVELPG